MIRTWLPGRVRYVRVRDTDARDGPGGFAGYRLLGTSRYVCVLGCVWVYMYVSSSNQSIITNPNPPPPPPQNRLDFDEETHGDAFLAPKGFRDSQGALRPNYASLRRAVTAATMAAAADSSSLPPAAAAPPAALAASAVGGGGAMAVKEGAQGPVLSVGTA